MTEFKGKVAFITGGASGAGFGMAQIFSEAGCKVVIADVRQDHLDKAMEHFKSKNAEVHPILLDITDRQAYIAAADEVERVYGTPPQLLLQSAGVNAFGPAEASTYEDYDWIMGVNLGGIINGMVTFVPPHDQGRTRRAYRNHRLAGWTRSRPQHSALFLLPGCRHQSHGDLSCIP